ncbi:MAG TPA: hypothetical protein VJC09_01020 [Candidatus Saccharimonadales bacterium]|nr:hypothetical protein [Candidatus Saccharimonadales bacterium]
MFIEHETAVVARDIVTDQVLDHIEVIADVFAGGTPVLDKQLQQELRHPFGDLLVRSGDALRPALPSLGFIDEDSSRSLAFIYGGIACLQAIGAENPTLAEAIRFRSFPYKDVIYPMSPDARTTLILGNEMLVATGIYAAIRTIESDSDPIGRSSELFGTGVGWTVYRAATTQESPGRRRKTTGCVSPYSIRS